MIDRYALAVLSLVALAAQSGCTQTVVAGSNDGGAGSTSSTTTATSTTTQTSTSTGSATNDPAVIAAATCDKRAACETVEATCVEEYTCYYALLRQDLWPVGEPCFSACGSFDDCFYGPIDDVPPPSEYATHEPACLSRLVGECGLGDDWCDYNCFDGEDYAAMQSCLTLPCDDIVDCFRTVVFAEVPVCTSI